MSDIKKAWIYKITSPSSKIYIGSTINLKNRVSAYNGLRCKNQIKLFNSLKKYGFKNHIFEVICECTTDDIFKQESYYGILYDVLGKKGLNGAIPKHGDKYESFSKETKEKIGLANKGRRIWLGRKHSDETKAKMTGKTHSAESKIKIGLASKGRKKSNETRAKLSLSLRGRKIKSRAKISEASRAKMSLSLMGNKRSVGRKHSDETKEKIGASARGIKNKTSIQLLNTTTGIYYDTIGEAATSTGMIFTTFYGRLIRNKTDFIKLKK